MTIGKATVLSLGFVGAVALGMWIGPQVLGRDAAGGRDERPAASVAQRPSAPTAQRPASGSGSGSAAVARASTPASVVPASEPALQKRLKPVLNQGTNMQMAAEGFRSGEEFAIVAHAARNTGTPFVVLKDRVVTKRMSLVAALRELKPDLDATAEANRARSMARSDIAALSS
jgi:hypothetical protein